MGNRLGVGAAAFAFVDDGDGSIDYPWDRGCAGTWDDSEWGTTACDDGLDNDGPKTIPSGSEPYLRGAAGRRPHAYEPRPIHSSPPS
jgi:hypothetical protein